MSKLVSKKTAILAKNIGFDCDCACYYNLNSMFNNAKSKTIHGHDDGVDIEDFYFNFNVMDDAISAPTQSQLFKFLREKHELYVHVDCNASGWLWEIEKTNGTSICWCNHSGPNLSGQWDTFEDALEDGLMRACEIVKQRNR